MPSFEEIEPFIRVYRGDIKTKTNIDEIDTVSPTEIRSYQDFQNSEGITFLFVSPVPQIERTLLRNQHENVSQERIFASITLKPKSLFELDFFLNRQVYTNAEEYSHLFQDYLTEERVQKILEISTFRRTYSAEPFEENPVKGTYIMNRTRIRENAAFVNARLLPTNWRNQTKRERFLNTTRTTNNGPLIGKPVHFLHPNAGKYLWSYVEEKLQRVGIDCICLQADSMNLAVKIYGPAGYYPAWKIGQLDQEGRMIMQIKHTSANERFRTCDYVDGPEMFKFLTDSVITPRYDWTNIRERCRAVEPRRGGTRKMRSQKIRKTRKLALQS